MDTLAHNLISAFPKLYFSVPTLRQPSAVQVEGREIALNPPKIAALWLAEVFCREKHRGYCQLGSLQAFVCHWYGYDPSSFSALITELENDDCLKRHLDRDVPNPPDATRKLDHRRKWLAVTPAGKQVLQEVKAKTVESLDAIVREVGKQRFKDKVRLFKALNELAEIAWVAMQQEIKSTQKEEDR